MHLKIKRPSLQEARLEPQEHNLRHIIARRLVEEEKLKKLGVEEEEPEAIVREIAQAQCESDELEQVMGGGCSTSRHKVSLTFFFLLFFIFPQLLENNFL